VTKFLRSLAPSIVISLSVAARAADVSIEDITVPIGTATVDVPILITPTSAEEMIGAMNIFFGAGMASDSIPILNTGTEFDGSIWESGESFGIAGTPDTHIAQGAVAMLAPLEVVPDGVLVTYTLNTSSLPAGDYVLDPDFEIEGSGTDATDGSIDPAPLDLTFVNGTLRIEAMQQLLDGDYNGNGTVEQADLDLVLLNWGDAADPVPGGWINDLPEGNIDQAELDGVLLNWGNMQGQMAAAGVPEPSTALSAATLAALALIRFVRRRRATR
jgi:hypothetical protein